MPLEYYNSKENGFNNEAILYWEGTIVVEETTGDPISTVSTINEGIRERMQDTFPMEIIAEYIFDEAPEFASNSTSVLVSSEGSILADEAMVAEFEAEVAATKALVELEAINASLPVDTLAINKAPVPSTCITFDNAKEINNIIKEKRGLKIAAQRAGDFEKAEIFREEEFKALDARDEMYRNVRESKRADRRAKNEPKTKSRKPNRRKGSGQGQVGKGKKTRGKCLGFHPGRCRK